ncbi:gamma-secretase subunit [Wolffia australiana]
MDEESFPLGGSGGAARRGISTAATMAWPTVDGPLGAENEEKALESARRFFFWGFFCLPWLWAVNCLYFWPALFRRHESMSSSSYAFPRLRPYIVRSAIGFFIFTAVLASWSLTFAMGGERLFGPMWNNLVMYNVADRLGLTSWN